MCLSLLLLTRSWEGLVGGLFLLFRWVTRRSMDFAFLLIEEKV